jgi:hypothetical protein
MALDVVAVPERCDLRLVRNGIRFETGNARLNHAAESRTDLNAVGEGIIGEHSGVLLA